MRGDESSALARALVRAFVVAATFCLASPVLGSSPGLELAGSHKALLETLTESYEGAYERTLEWYDRALEDAPFDVVLATERCRFIAGTMDSENHAFYDRAESDHEACLQNLQERFPDHHEVLLYELEQTYGEDLIAAGSKMRLERAFPSWTNGQMGRYHSAMAAAYDGQGNAALAQWHAAKALEFDRGANTRLIVARGQISRGDRAGALATLTSPLGMAELATTWEQGEELSMLAEIGARSEALTIYNRLNSEKSGAYDHLKVARALASIDVLDPARREIQQVIDQKWRGADGAREAFLFELRHGTGEQALEAYRQLRDYGRDQDPMLHLRVLLLVRDISLPWEWRDALGGLTILGVLAAAGLAALLFLSFIHHVGLARRLRGLGPHVYAAGWNLRQAWFVFLGVFVCILLPGYFAGVPAPGSPPNYLATAIPEGAALARVTLIFMASLATLAILLAIGARKRGLAWVSLWPAWKAAVTGVGLGIALQGVSQLALMFAPVEPRATVEAWRVFQPEMVAVADHFGVPAMLAILVVYAPVVEEFLFRRVLLGAFSRHMRFAAANVLQAGLFAALHMELIFFPFLFVMGWVAGTLARRSGGLLAPMMLHAVANLVIAAWYVLARQ